MHATEGKQAEERLAKLNECFLRFGSDPRENINRLTALCGELMGAACALYNRLDKGMLCSWGQWRTPPDYNPLDRPEGHICYDVIKRGDDQVFVIRNLPETPYAKTDPNVVRYKLQTYVGRAVKFGGANVGSLCVVYQDDFVPSEEDKRLMEIIASAIGVEERRRQAEEALKRSVEELAAVHEIEKSIITKPDLSSLLGFIVGKARELTGADAAFYSFIEDVVIRHHTFLGIRTKAFKNIELRKGTGLGWLAMEEGKPVVVEDFFSDERLKDAPYDAVKKEGLISFLAVPIMSQG
jgi:GAF domain-containing protein